MKIKSISKAILATSLLSLLTACNHLEKKSYYTNAELDVSYIDEAWGGQLVPYHERCIADGGKGNSPALTIENIPQGVTAVLVEFGDSNDFFMKGSGFGVIGKYVELGQTSVTIPSIKEGQVSNLPEDMFIHKGYKKGRFLRSNKGYLAPCFGERGHDYYATVKAIYESNNLIERSEVFGYSRIFLGQY